MRIKDQKKHMESVNVLGTRNVVLACQQTGVKKLIFTSHALGRYGGHPHAGWPWVKRRMRRAHPLGWLAWGHWPFRQSRPGSLAPFAPGGSSARGAVALLSHSSVRARSFLQHVPCTPLS